MASASATSVRPTTCSEKIWARFSPLSMLRRPSKAKVTAKQPNTAPETVPVPPITSMPRITNVSLR